MTHDEAQLASFFAIYEPAIAKLGKGLRAKLRKRLPGLFELAYVYPNRKSLVIAYSPTEHGIEGLCSFALYPHGAHLYFTHGTALSKADPQKLLQGRAKVRYVVINAASDLDRPELEALMSSALKLAKLKLVAGAKHSLIIKTDGTQRPRKTAKRS